MANDNADQYRSQQFIPKVVAITSAVIAIVASILISIFVFYIPHADIKDRNEAAICVVQSAKLACNKECRLVKVMSESFSDVGIVERDGRRNAPCDSEKSCDESFECLYRTNPLVVREQIPSVSVGFVLFLTIGVVLAIPTLFFALYYSLSSYPVRVILFVPQGVNVVLLTDSIREVWPPLDARGLKYIDAQWNENTNQMQHAVYRAIESPWIPDKLGMVIVIVAAADNYQAILDAVPQSFYRVLVIPQLEACLKEELGKLQQDDKLDVENNIETNSSKSEHEKNVEEQVRTAHTKLKMMSEQFDSVYKVGELEMGSYRWIARRAMSQYVPYKIGCIAIGQRVENNLRSFGEWFLRVMCCASMIERNQQPRESNLLC